MSLEIKLPEETFQAGDKIEGTVVLTGGNSSRRIRSLAIRLVRKWSWESYSVGRDLDYAGYPKFLGSVSDQMEYELDGGRGTEEVFSAELAEEVTIGPEEMKEFAFAIDLSGVRQRSGLKEEWELHARAAIPLARDALAHKTIGVSP